MGSAWRLQNGKIAGPKLFVPLPQDRVKLVASDLQQVEILCAPLQYG